MPITNEFEYHRPRDLKEALKLLWDYKGKARVLAGGTDLVIWLKEGFASPEAVIDLKGIGELSRLEFKDGVLTVGALVTFTQLIESEVVRARFPLLWESARTVASPGIRNRATLMGNIASAVPSLDGGPALLLHEAKVTVHGKAGRRAVPMRSWFTGPKKCALLEDEIASEIAVPLPERKHAGCYAKLGRYRGEDLAQVGVGAMALEGGQYRVAFCAVGPVPTRAESIEACLKGKGLSDIIIKRAKALIPDEISPIADIRASKEYRSHMAGVMLERALKAAASRLEGKGPAYGTEQI
ncbi:MAG: xanthine dehydrogenase family protein subunit M [Elusimicrobia bacterium]|nr:xanthine dehydrogenase family protein subunit M [Elusimicrobiota bacterium]